MKSGILTWRPSSHFPPSENTIHDNTDKQMYCDEQTCKYILGLTSCMTLWILE